jgi:hypothetical protein
MPTLVATLGATNANSYQTLAALDAAAGDLYPRPTAFEAAETWDREGAAIQATRTLDQLPWRGEKVDETQALAWPREGIIQRNGEEVDTESIPAVVLDAHTRLSCFLVEQVAAGVDPTAASDGAGVQRIDLGSELGVTFQPGYQPGRPVDAFVREVIRPILRGLLWADQPVIL